MREFERDRLTTKRVPSGPRVNKGCTKKKLTGQKLE
jgi:hypothetical protein